MIIITLFYDLAYEFPTIIVAKLYVSKLFSWWYDIVINNEINNDAGNHVLLS